MSNMYKDFQDSEFTKWEIPEEGWPSHFTMRGVRYKFMSQMLNSIGGLCDGERFVSAKEADAPKEAPTFYVSEQREGRYFLRLVPADKLDIEGLLMW